MLTSLKDAMLWISFGFVLLLVLFLMLAFFLKDRLSDAQRSILRFVCALCAGFAGFFMTGEALFRLATRLGNGTNLVVSGSAGAALFFAIWFTYDRGRPTPPDGINIRIPSQWSFQRTALARAQQDGAVVEFEGFQAEELSALLEPQELRSATVGEALLALRLLAGTPIRQYRVEHRAPVYVLTVKS